MDGAQQLVTLSSWEAKASSRSSSVAIFPVSPSDLLSAQVILLLCQHLAPQVPAGPTDLSALPAGGVLALPHSDLFVKNSLPVVV